MNKFLDNLQPENTYLCFTHCDETKVTKTLAKEKI